MIRDEQGNWSAARTLLTGWLVFSAGYIAWSPAPSNAALSLLGGVATALIAWAGGPRIAQYVGPQIGATASAIGQAVREQIAKRRASGEHEETP